MQKIAEIWEKKKNWWLLNKSDKYIIIDFINYRCDIIHLLNPYCSIRISHSFLTDTPILPTSLSVPLYNSQFKNTLFNHIILIHVTNELFVIAINIGIQLIFYQSEIHRFFHNIEIIVDSVKFRVHSCME